MLTEILLEVTDNEIYSVARSVYNKAKANASKGRFKKPAHNLRYSILIKMLLNRFVFDDKG